MKALIPFLLFLPLSALANPVCGQPVKIAVIDTGFSTVNGNAVKVRLCDTGHKDFSGVNKFAPASNGHTPIPTDEHGHGTNVAGLIDLYARESGVNYCIVILKFYDVNRGYHSQEGLIKAIQYASTIHATIMNISGGGNSPIEAESKAVKVFLDGGGVVVAAAGNEGRNLSIDPYFPAMSDPRIIVVGSLDGNLSLARHSNFGTRVNAWEPGVNQEALGLMMTGTSQSTAIHTGRLVTSWGKSCLKKIRKITKISK
jgi:serine protease